MWWTQWWTWMVAGLVLAILEVLAPAWIFLGFAIGAGLTGLLLLVGGPMAGAMVGSVPLLLLIFALLSLGAWLVLRRVFGLKGGSVRTFENDINDN